MRIRKKVLYRGRVQGVGFRYTAVRQAEGLDVAGYVRNLPTGEVELVAEGEPAGVQELLRRVADLMAGYIRETDEVDEQPVGLQGFTIRR
jgi:acylphosphatase